MFCTFSACFSLTHLLFCSIVIHDWSRCFFVLPDLQGETNASLHARRMPRSILNRLKGKGETMGCLPLPGSRGRQLAPLLPRNGTNADGAFSHAAQTRLALLKILPHQPRKLFLFYAIRVEKYLMLSSSLL